MKTPRQIATELISRWEGVLSLDPKDNGNYVVVNGVKTLIGSKYGVTGNALALHRHVKPETITRHTMADLTIDEAVDVAINIFYKGFRLDMLPWGRVTAIMLDFVWASGGNAIKVLQKTLGVKVDGILGNDTRSKFVRELTDYSEKGFANKLLDARISYIESLKDYVTYGRGWTNRITAFRPETPWWRSFDA